MELRQLRHLAAVLQRASFSAAAADLHITQPALSKSLRSLEKALGVKLLDRGPNGVHPTIFGENLATYAHLVLAQVSEAEHEIAALRGGQKGRLRLGAMPAALRTIVPTAVRSFLDTRSNVQLSVIEGLNDALLSALRRGSLDLVVTAVPPELFDPEIEFRILMEEKVLIVCGRQHPLSKRQSLRLADLAPFGWIVPQRLEPDRRHLERLFAAALLPAPNVVMETTSVTLLPRMLSDTAYLTYLPSSSVEETRDFMALSLDTPTWTRTTAAAFRQKGPMRPLLASFLKSLENAARQNREGRDVDCGPLQN